jgi:hypothetical protein
MMLATPIPPTTREIAATAAVNSVRNVMNWLRWSSRLWNARTV